MPEPLILIPAVLVGLLPLSGFLIDVAGNIHYLVLRLASYRRRAVIGGLMADVPDAREPVCGACGQPHSPLRRCPRRTVW